MAEPITIERAMRDERLFGGTLGGIASWLTWLAVLKAAFGLALSGAEAATFAAVAGGRAVPTQRVRELWAIVGRRGGKSRIAALVACFLALFVKHSLAAGERGLLLVLSGSQEQSRVVFGYALAFLQASPVLRQEIVDTTRSEIRLRNGVTIAIHANSFRTLRGRTLVGAVFDEVALWRDESSAQPDTEVYTSVLPALLTTRGMLIAISTGYRRLGLLYQKHRDNFGVDSPDTLVVQGSTLQFNKTLSETDIAAQRAADPGAAGAEWDGGFRDDISTFLDDALIDGAVEYGRPLELPPMRGAGIAYRAFTDAAGGVGGGDAYCVSVGHKQGEHFIIDLVRGTAGKFDPQEVTKSYATWLLKEYGVHSVTGDSYAAGWVAGAWGGTGVAYMRSELPKSQIYLETVPLFARGLVRLPDHPKLLRELRLLERHTHRSGKDSIDHPRGGHDDHCNVVCGVLRELSNYPGYDTQYKGFQPATDDSKDAADANARWRLHNYLSALGVPPGSY
jgi:hypothetical protein